MSGTSPPTWIRSKCELLYFSSLKNNLFLPWRVLGGRRTGRGCLRTQSLESQPSARCSLPLISNVFIDPTKCFWWFYQRDTIQFMKALLQEICRRSLFLPRISLAFAQRIFTSLSLITSHFLNCSICWSRSLVSPILTFNCLWIGKAIKYLLFHYFRHIIDNLQLRV